MRLSTVHMILFACLLCTTQAARILGIFPFAARSHFNYNHAILKSLHAAGHQITMVSPFPSEEKVENFTYIDSHLEGPVYIGQSRISDWADMTLIQIMEWAVPAQTQYCYDIMKVPHIQEAMRSSEKLYDVMFIQLYMEYSCYLPIAEKLGVPVIGTTTQRSWQFANHAVGAFNNPAVVPMLLSGLAYDMNFIERVENLVKYLIADYYYYTRFESAIDQFYREHFSEDLLHKKGVSLLFYNTHASVTYRPVVPKVVEIGGIHVEPVKALPKDLQVFIDEAPHGVILFTFGSVVRGSSMTPSQRDAFVAAFASIPQRVIWKFEEPIDNLSENVMILDWLPQRDILEHKNVIIFMSHCGQCGVYEAIVTATPIVTIPLFTDQRANAVILQRLGVGTDLQLKTVTKDAVLTALYTIINDSSYNQRSRELSQTFQDRPITPQESVVYWTEYIIKHKGAPHLKVLGSDMSFHLYFMLDIVAGALLVLISVVILVRWMARKMFLLISNRIESVLKKNE